MSNFLDLNRLIKGLGELNLSLTDNQIQQIDAYAEMLFKWNKTFNLTSITDKEEVLTHHILDSLATVSTFSHYLLPGRSLLDVGSGGGLPAIPLAIVFPDSFVSMIDPVGKKTAFLTQTGVYLKLKNIKVIHNRVENITAPLYDVISSRAFSSLSSFVSLSNHLLKDDGIWIALKGKNPSDELLELGENFTNKVISVSVPFLPEERNLVLIKRIGTL